MSSAESTCSYCTALEHKIIAATRGAKSNFLWRRKASQPVGGWFSLSIWWSHLVRARVSLVDFNDCLYLQAQVKVSYRTAFVVAESFLNEFWKLFRFKGARVFNCRKFYNSQKGHNFCEFNVLWLQVEDFWPFLCRMLSRIKQESCQIQQAFMHSESFDLCRKLCLFKKALFQAIQRLKFYFFSESVWIKP